MPQGLCALLRARPARRFSGAEATRQCRHAGPEQSRGLGTLIQATSLREVYPPLLGAGSSSGAGADAV